MREAKEVPTTPMKKCNICNTIKPLEDFSQGRNQCKLCRIAFQKEYGKKYNKYFKEYKRRFLEKNPEYYKDYDKPNIRRNIYTSFKNNGFKLPLKYLEILGCSREYFISYIESKFEPWMNWDNYGRKNGVTKSINVSWDLDHIIPSSSAKTIEDCVRLNHYTNFQPLCSFTNEVIKNNKLNFC